MKYLYNSKDEALWVWFRFDEPSRHLKVLLSKDRALNP